MSVFFSILQADRARFNARFIAARGLNPRLDGDDWLLILREIVAPIIESSARQTPERASEVAAALYDAGLELLGRDLLGPRARHPLINAGWKLLLPVLATPLNQNPRRTIALVSNALHSLSNKAGAQPMRWIERMQAVAPHCADVETLSRAGFAIAWRCGLAHYRPRALQLLHELSPEIGAAAVDRLENLAAWPQILSDLENNLWFDPDAPADAERALRVKYIVGAFSGLGGTFPRPPRVTRRDEHFWVSDEKAGRGWRLLSVDAFGATIESTADFEVEESQNEGEFRLENDGTVCLGEEKIELPQLAGASSWAFDCGTLVATIPLSHSVYVVAATK